jgi:N-acetyl-beta-hexosaminidase
MSEVIAFSHPRDDTWWAVVASLGKLNRVAEIYPTRLAALADRAWREQQVHDYAHLLESCRQTMPRYSVVPMRRADLPRKWKPLPALGFLRGQFAF